MREWLKNWYDVVILGKKKEVKFSFRGGNASGNINSKAILISGPPGIGKTSSVRLICQELQYKLIENNSSDTRTKNTINTTIKDLSRNTIIH